jgi:hypothetical protein
MIGVFVMMIEKRSEIRTMQKETEELSLALDYVAKKLRTSAYVSACDGNMCKVHLNSIPANESDGFDTVFTFESADKTLQEKTSLDDVGSDGVGIISDVEGRFAVKMKSGSGIPRITVQLYKVGKPQTAVQTTVSLRNYDE